MRRFGVVLVLATLAACGHAQEGDLCEGGDPQCSEDKQSMLECGSDGHYRAIPCPGPEACRFVNEASEPLLSCDLTGSHSGDECPEDFADFVICKSATAAIVCGGDIWRNRSCPNVCRSGVGGVGDPESVGECD